MKLFNLLLLSLNLISMLLSFIGLFAIAFGLDLDEKGLVLLTIIICCVSFIFSLKGFIIYLRKLIKGNFRV